MDQEMAKSLVNLIDETISEIEDLKKSRYSAAETRIGDDDSGVSGASKSGDVAKEEAAKAEGKNSEADPGTRGVTSPAMCADPGKSSLHAEAAKAEDKEYDGDDDDDEKKKKKKDDDMDKAEGKNREAAPGEPGKVSDDGADSEKSNLHSEAAKAEEAIKAEKPAEGYDIKKSIEEQEALFKGYVDDKFGKLETRLSAILDVVKEMGDEPAAARGVPAGLVPLAKSGEEVETLSKSQTLDKLLELKKSGTYVDTADIASVEMGGDAQAIVEKYSLN